MIEAIQSDILLCQPLRVRHVTYDGFFSFVWGGDGWSIAVTAPWRVQRGIDMVTAADSESAPDDVWTLIGHDLIGIERRSVLTDIDPRYVFNGGVTLDVLTDNHLDPWVVHLNGSIYVADGISEMSLDESGARIDALGPAGRSLAGGRVTSVSVEEERLLLHAAQVSFVVSSPWRVARNGTLIVSSDLSEKYEELNSLIGLSLDRVIDDGQGLDACLVLSDGVVVENLSMTPARAWAVL